jgi:hypothetical protein
MYPVLMAWHQPHIMHEHEQQEAFLQAATTLTGWQIGRLSFLIGVRLE